MTFLQELAISTGTAFITFLIGWACDRFKKPSGTTILLAVILFACSGIYELSHSVHELSTQLGSKEALSKIRDPILKSQARAAVREGEEAVREATEGRTEFKTIGSMMSAYHQIFRKCRKNDEVFATSYVSITNVWNTQLGIDALESNKIAIGQGAKIRRVFILPNANEVSAASIEFRKHHDIGVEVYWVAETSIAQQERKDFLVTLNGVVLEFTPGGDGSPTVAKYIISDGVSRSYQTLWESIKARATRWKP